MENIVLSNDKIFFGYIAEKLAVLVKGEHVELNFFGDHANRVVIERRSCRSSLDAAALGVGYGRKTGNRYKSENDRPEIRQKHLHY